MSLFGYVTNGYLITRIYWKALAEHRSYLEYLATLEDPHEYEKATPWCFPLPKPTLADAIHAVESNPRANCKNYLRTGSMY